MKCYNHPRIDAVGYCAVCKRGVCNSCQVIMEGKRFCKQHAEGQLRREERAGGYRKRGAAITVAAVVAVLDGLAGVVVGFLLIIVGMLAPTAETSYVVFSSVRQFVEYFADVLRFPSLTVILVGLVIFVLGSIDMYAGYQLWRQSRIAAIVGVIVAIVGGLMIGGYLEILALAGSFTFLYIASAVLKIILIGLGWRHLRIRFLSKEPDVRLSE